MQTHIAENRKPAFRWLGTKDDLVGPATRMRITGNEFQSQNASQSLNCSSLSIQKTQRGLKRACMDAPRAEATPSKRTALKPLQPRDSNTMTPHSRDVINKPVPLYPRASQVDSPVSDPRTLNFTASPHDAAESPTARGTPRKSTGKYVHCDFCLQWHLYLMSIALQVPLKLFNGSWIWSLYIYISVCVCVGLLRCVYMCLSQIYFLSSTASPFDAGGWREWGDSIQTQAIPITPPWSAQCCDHAGSSNAVALPGTSSPICTPGITSQTPGTPTMTPMSGRSCCTCQSRGSLDNLFPFRPPGALFNPFFPPPPFPMLPQLAAAAAAAGFPFPPTGFVPEQFLGSDPTRSQDCSQHRVDNGITAAAALQYQNEGEFFIHVHFHLRIDRISLHLA